MAEPAGTSLLLVSHVEIVEIFLSVPELGVEGRLRERKEVFFMAFEAEVVIFHPFFKRHIQLFRIFPLQKSDVG